MEQGAPVDVSNKALAFIQFASLAAMTQGVLLLNQVVLLPIQIRVWGTQGAAEWISIMAVAAVTSIADFGLRAAGHAELIRHANDPDDHEAREEFAQLWAWIRILITATTSLLLVGDFLYHHLYLGAPYPVWRTALVLGIALEVLLGVRIGYLDSQGYYRESEAGYLTLAGARLFLALGALLIFHAQPFVLAWIWFFTGVYAIVQQGRLCNKIGRLRLLEPIPSRFSPRTLATIRHTMADPCSSWVRINGPVVVLTAMGAPPYAIVIYAALRAVFGMARTTILQISRFASVEYVSLRQARQFELAEMHLTLMVLLAAFFASVAAAFVVADNGRLATLWLKLNGTDFPVYELIALTFGLGNAFYAYQIAAGVCRRTGEVAEIAHRQYFYIACAAVFAVVGLVTKSLVLFLLLMLLADVLIALSFMLGSVSTATLRQTSAGWRGAVASGVSSVLVLVMWMIIHFEKFNFLLGYTPPDILGTIAFFLLWVLLIGFVDVSLVYGLRVREMSFSAALADWVQRLRAAKNAR